MSVCMCVCVRAVVHISLLPNPIIQQSPVYPQYVFVTVRQTKEGMSKGSVDVMLPMHMCCLCVCVCGRTWR